MAFVLGISGTQLQENDTLFRSINEQHNIQGPLRLRRSVNVISMQETEVPRSCTVRTLRNHFSHHQHVLWEYQTSISRRESKLELGLLLSPILPKVFCSPRALLRKRVQNLRSMFHLRTVGFAQSPTRKYVRRKGKKKRTSLVNLSIQSFGAAITFSLCCSGSFPSSFSIFVKLTSKLSSTSQVRIRTL